MTFVNSAELWWLLQKFHYLLFPALVDRPRLLLFHRHFHSSSSSRSNSHLQDFFLLWNLVSVPALRLFSSSSVWASEDQWSLTPAAEIVHGCSFFLAFALGRRCRKYLHVTACFLLLAGAHRKQRNSWQPGRLRKANYKSDSSFVWVLAWISPLMTTESRGTSRKGGSGQSGLQSLGWFEHREEDCQLTVPNQKMCLETQTISCIHLFSLFLFSLKGSFSNCWSTFRKWARLIPRTSLWETERRVSQWGWRKAGKLLTEDTESGI